VAGVRCRPRVCRSRRQALLPALLAVVVATGTLASCGSGSSAVRVGPARSAEPKALTDAPDVHVKDSSRPPQSYDVFLASVVESLRTYWQATYPAIADGQAYRDLDGGVWPVWQTARSVPGCGESQTHYREIQDNAFYCPEGDFIAFDDARLFPALDRKFGSFTLAVVLAHEWGHAIQRRRGYDLEGVVTELQADCFAGSWMAAVQKAPTGALDLTDPELFKAITGILQFRDDPGTTADEDGAHGSAFDRLGSFQDGLLGGAKKCDSYADVPPVVLELPFANASTNTDRTGPGLARLVAEVPAALDRYWNAQLRSKGAPPALAGRIRKYQAGGPYPSCAGLTDADYAAGVVYCPSPEFIGYQEGGQNKQLHDTIGDFSVAILFAEGWAEAVQHHLGVTSTSSQAQLQRDCLTGAWVADVVPRRTGAQAFTISPGDLDEAVKTYLALTEGDRGSAEAALARIGSFRGGLFSGVERCGLPA